MEALMRTSGRATAAGPSARQHHGVAPTCAPSASAVMKCAPIIPRSAAANVSAAGSATVASTSGGGVGASDAGLWRCDGRPGAFRSRPSPRAARVVTAAATAEPAAAASTSSSSSTVVAPEDIVSPKAEARLTLAQYKEIYDRLIAIFQSRPRDDWKKLIVFSRQWDQHAQGVFDRIKEMADGEADVDKKMALRKLFRALQNVNDEISRYNRVLLKLAEAGDDEWEAIVAAYRGDLQLPFFGHMQCLIAAAKDDPSRRDQLVLVNTRLVALISNHDAVAAEPEKLEAAAELYRDLLSSISSVEELDKKMGELASSGRIDPAFLQISAKAYGAARDTNMSKDEAKWVAYKLYRQARDYFDRQQPVEKRIIEYLLSMSDPSERTSQLDKAVTPGPTRNTETHDFMYSTPERLFLVLDQTLRAYHAMRDGAAKNLNTPEAAVLPRKVRVMMELRDEIIRRYL